ncbi:MAG TPA: alpha/beta hydrolase [Anaerolineales bacterium]|nr:alpha/beta hydrolase [Anaerolineales bacterium]
MQTRTFAQKILDWLKRALIRLSILLVVLTLTGMIYQTAATEADQRDYPPPGVLVNVEGHKMHIHCMGAGSPTIVLDHAGGGSSVDWSLIQPRLAAHTRVCAYDRAGYGWSDYNPAPRTLEQQVRELHALLRGVNELGPYILVGHSYGARVDRVFAAKYPHEVAGLVLIDPGVLYDDPRYPAEARAEFESENGMIRAAGWLAPFGLVRVLQPMLENPTFDLPEEARLASASFPATTRYWQSLNDQIDVLSTVFEEERQVVTLGEIPLLILSSTEPDNATHRVWRQANSEMAALSSNGSHREVEGATHFSLVYRQNHAQVCIDGILEVLDAVYDQQVLNRRTE